MPTLDELRESLDEFDTQIITLLAKRLDVVEGIGNLKKEQGLDIIDRRREQEVLGQVAHIVKDPLLHQCIHKVYKTLIEESRLTQEYKRHTEIPFSRIGIVGLGLIGGSICKGIKVKNPSITIRALTHTGLDLDNAFAEGWIDQEHSTMQDLVEQSDLIIIATPISSVISVANEIAHATSVNQKLIVIDVSGVKREFTEHFENLSNDHMEFISTHPMAGKESSGFANSEPLLFFNKPWVLLPHEKNTAEGLCRVEKLMFFLGGKPLILSSDKHDRNAALVSHLPGIIAKNYLKFVDQTDSDAVRMAGPGFYSFTRLAHDNPVMREEMIHGNKDIIDPLWKAWVNWEKSKALE